MAADVNDSGGKFGGGGGDAAHFLDPAQVVHHTHSHSQSHSAQVLGIARNIAKCCPKAIVCVITNPVNSTVPIVAEALRAAGCFDPARVGAPQPQLPLPLP
jgi:hypothetical protein